MKYKSIDLSAYRTISVENISFINAELENLEKTCIQASDVLQALSAGISTALHDRIPYNDTPALIEIAGASGVGRALSYIPYMGIAMTGINWGISGSVAKTKAQGKAVEIKIEVERMYGVISGLKAIRNRIAEGEALLYALSAKLKKSLDKLKTFEELSDESAKEVDTSIQLIKSIKQVIETDICNADGYLTKHSGIIFHKIEKEVQNVQ